MRRHAFVMYLKPGMAAEYRRRHYNLIYNAALLVEEGVGYAISLDKLVNVTGRHNLCFRPFEPRLESGLNIVWKKYQVFSAAAELFQEKLREKFAETGE